TQPQDFARRIEGSLDRNLVSPINYSWNLTFGRKFPKGMYVEGSYIGRLARHLLATRDVMQVNNIVDQKSGQDWYTASGILEQYRAAKSPIASIPKIPFFENLYAPGLLAAKILTSPLALSLSNTQAAYAYMSLNSGGPSDCGTFGGCKLHG